MRTRSISAIQAASRASSTTRSSEGVSIGYFAVLMVGFALWVAYGIASRDLPLVVPNSVAFLVMGPTKWR
jgi:uncharacterized protein with PQ loop repeat